MVWIDRDLALVYDFDNDIRRTGFFRLGIDKKFSDVEFFAKGEKEGQERNQDGSKAKEV